VTDFKTVIEWFDLGGNLKLSDAEAASSLLKRLEVVQGLFEKTDALGVKPDSPAGVRAAAAEMVLEGLYSVDKISRSEERGFAASERKAAAQELYRDYTIERNRYKKPLN
jgi:magnesium chelatase subunit I